jgi:DNA-binding transcriptional regulator YiaG
MNIEMAKPIKTIDTYRADELGLPILIKGVSVIEIDGHEVMDIDYAKISEVLFVALIIKPFPLTGAEVRFMRLFMGLTLESLATSLHVTHPTILSWEKCGNEMTKMTDSTEAILRMFAAKQGAKDNELIGVILNRFFGGLLRILVKNMPRL